MTQNARILVVGAIPPELRRRLEGRYTLVDYQGKDERGNFPETAGFRVAVTTSMHGASEALMAALPDLGLIACNGTGLEYIDLAAAARRGIVVRNTPDVVTEDTAEFAIGMMHSVLRRMAEGDRFVRAGRWGVERMGPSRRLAGKKLGIVGLGKVGSAVARRASALGLSVHYTGPRRKPDVDYEFIADVGELAETCDVLMLCCPGGEATRGLVGADVLRSLGADGFLINMSRGSVVDEAALIEALSNGTIAGAGLDVFVNEPSVDPRFSALDNVVLEPHYAAVTRETREAMATMLETAIVDFLAGRAVPDVAANPR